MPQNARLQQRRYGAQQEGAEWPYCLDRRGGLDCGRSGCRPYRTKFGHPSTSHSIDFDREPPCERNKRSTMVDSAYAQSARDYELGPAPPKHPKTDEDSYAPKIRMPSRVAKSLPYAVLRDPLSFERFHKTLTPFKGEQCGRRKDMSYSAIICCCSTMMQTMPRERPMSPGRVVTTRALNASRLHISAAKSRHGECG